MTAPSDFKQVSVVEFQNFIRDYPNELDRDVCAISEPPLISYNDFTTGLVWPESMVAKTHDGDPREYWIKR
jgi:hypothetical protein